MSATTATLTLQTARGAYAITPVWRGQHLAVHKPLTRDASGATAVNASRGLWAVTHCATGYSACATLTTSKTRAVALARLWDSAFSAITARGDAKGWPLARQWALDVKRCQAAQPLYGPVALTPLQELELAGSAAQVEAAVRRAMGYTPAPEPEASEQFPAAITARTAGSGAVRRNPTSGALEYWWLPTGGNYAFDDAMALAGWYDVPALADIESWCLGSVAETPCGDNVEPDHPDAWPRLLGVI